MAIGAAALAPNPPPSTTTPNARSPRNPMNHAWVGGARAVQQQRMGRTTLTIGTDLDSEFATLHRLGSLTIPAREGDLHIFGQPPGDDVATDTWRSSTIDAAGHAALDLGVGPVTATIGARLDGWILTASRLTPRVGSTPGIGSQTIDFTLDPRASVKVALADNLDARVDAGR